MSLEWIAVDSTAVEAVAYEDGELFIEYAGGRSYVYFVVPDHIFETLMHADSIGQFINEEIKPKYAYREL